MKVFLCEDGYLMHYIDGVWTDGDLIYHDLNGNPIGYMGQAVEGTHMNVVVMDGFKNEWGSRFNSCMNHGVSIEFHCPDGTWHPMAFAKDLRHAVVPAELIMKQQGREHQTEKYRLLCCSCNGVVEVPELEESC
jgi:putative NADPH-quinone reductase